MSGQLPHATSDLVQNNKITVPWFAWVQKVERLIASVTATATAAQTTATAAATAAASPSISISGVNGVSVSGTGSSFTVDGQADQHILAAQIFGR